jgi:two-component system, chemotaxis family, protein-glutamate methylesterase/glutaminase
MSAQVPVIRVLIVDDSAFVRKVVREMLSRHADIEVVGTARDGEEALQYVEELRPDVVTCDLMMPRVDGVEFVRRQMRRRPLPILVLTSSPEDAPRVLETLQSGAIDLVRKPTALATDELMSIREQLAQKIRDAARATIGNLRGEVMTTESVVAPAARRVVPPAAGKIDVVVIGISTGGPQALRRLLPMLPADFPVPIALVLHMPVGYTALYAQKLDEICALEVVEAHESVELRPGRVIVAQAGRHLVLRRAIGGKVLAHLSMQPIDKIHRPSVDVLFRSAADAYGERVLAVVMTGMGDDGKQGAAWIKACGGAVLTEAESSCVIYGMPRSVAEAGLSDAAVPLDGMAQAILQRT